MSDRFCISSLFEEISLSFFRKKLSGLGRLQDWKHSHNNYVAKHYMVNDIGKDVYLEDVRLQMDAKLWGEEYNRHNPPKKVFYSTYEDILQL